MEFTENKFKELIELNPSDWSYTIINTLESNKPNSAALWYLNIIDHMITLRKDGSNRKESWKSHLNKIKLIINGAQSLPPEILIEKSKLIFHEFKDKNEVSFLLSYAYSFQASFIAKEIDKYKRDMAFAAIRFMKDGETIIPVLKKYYDLQMSNGFRT